MKGYSVRFNKTLKVWEVVRNFGDKDVVVYSQSRESMDNTCDALNKHFKVSGSKERVGV